MRFLEAFTLILSLTIISFPLNAGRVSTGNGPKDPLEDLPRQKTVLPSPISAEESRRSYAKETAVDDEQIFSTKHTIKSSCACRGCYCGGCKRDLRYKVDPEDDLNRATAFITAYFPEEEVWRRGTAWTVGENCIAMAAHTVYRNGKFATKAMLVFGMQEEVKCGCCFACKTINDAGKAIINTPIFAIHPDFLKDPDSAYDLAVMTLKKPLRDDFMAAGVDFSPYEALCGRYEGVEIISREANFTYGDAAGFSLGERYGILSMGKYSSDELTGQPVVIPGYPAYVGRACKPLYNMYATRGKAAYVRGGRIIHDGNTSDGVSGGPIFLGSTGEVIGLHTGDYNVDYNQGVWFDASSIDFLTTYLQAFDREWATVNISMPSAT